MAVSHLYILHPPATVQQWIEEVDRVLREDPKWVDWELVSIPFDASNNFRVNDIVTRVVHRPGPVVVFESANCRALNLLWQQLWMRSFIIVVVISDATDLWQRIVEAREAHDVGEPLLPQKYVAAVQLIRKLYRKNAWGGTRNKNFVWLDTLVTGGGVDPALSGVVPEVANDLRLKGLLLAKYGGGGRKKQKYALNIDRIAEIELIIKSGVFEDEAIMAVLSRDKRNMTRDRLRWDRAVDLPQKPERRHNLQPEQMP